MENIINVKLSLQGIEYLVELLQDTEGFTEIEVELYKTLSAIVKENEVKF